MAMLETKRSELCDAASTAKINRELARLAVERLGWEDPRATLVAWHKYIKARVDEASAEDELFSYDLGIATKAPR
jgi:hypothetical protein